VIAPWKRELQSAHRASQFKPRPIRQVPSTHLLFNQRYCETIALMSNSSDGTAASAGSAKIEPQWFRQVLGQYPTGVCVVTANPPDTGPAGMVVGSFTSVSLDPPLIAFFPDKGSSSWPKIERAGSFCVNILGADQEPVCRQFASKAADKFEGQAHRPAGSGAPILEDSVAWIDCDVHSVQEAGDHYIVIGRVRELQLERTRLPLLFFQGGYGRFSAFSLAAPNTQGSLTLQLRHVDIIRPEMERLAEDLGSQCIATARVGDELVVAASAGNVRQGDSTATLVGQHLPFRPPTGSAFAAWNGEAEIEDWLKLTGSSEARTAYRASLAAVRTRGYSIGLLSEAQRAFASKLGQLAAEPTSASHVDLYGMVEGLVFDPVESTADTNSAIRLISAPVFGSGGTVALVLTVYEFQKPTNGIQTYIDRVLEASTRATKLIGGEVPFVN
jgi:flavin reductase (DIM6/NTAB) family NADH-FMN oxidoreductase RutF/DNA-binding IclR family transcriptional regulator